MEVDEDTLNLVDYPSTNGTNASITKMTEVIETIDVSNYPSSNKRRHSNCYNKEICKDNKPLTDFINKCLFIDHTKGMEIIINKVLLPSYVKADREYKLSEKFRRVITKAFQRLLDDPDKKYSHISDVVDTLKFHVATPSKLKANPTEKKRVNFVTLSTKVSVKPNHDRKRPMIESSSRNCPAKKSKPEVIALDCDDDEVIPIDDEANKDISNYYNQVEDHKCKLQTEESNLVSDDTDAIEIQDSQEVKIVEETIAIEKHNEHVDNVNCDKATVNAQEKTTIECEKENLGSNENLLVPHKSQKEKIVNLEKPKLKKKEPAKKPEEMTEEQKARRIKIIEAKIQMCNKTIARLDLEEVTDDSANSPYYKCDRLRTTIVKLYKELCTLVGEEAPKRRKIQLQIKEGVPQGPIKRLEKFLNKQADEEGETPFPDFSDVVRCVEKANEKDGLGWSKAQVIKEAQSIFTYCGRALQKRRQQREWKHLRALAVPEEFEADPAERDLELQARLEANRRLASQREAEVFNKFTNMEDTPEPAASTSFSIEPSELEDSSSDEDTPAQDTVLKESNNIDSTVNSAAVTVNTVNSVPAETVNTVNSVPAGTVNTINSVPAGTVNTVNSVPAGTVNTINSVPAGTVNTVNSVPAGTVNTINSVPAVTVNSVPAVSSVESDVVVKQEPEVPMKIQYQGDVSLVINISDSESEDEFGVLTF